MFAIKDEKIFVCAIVVQNDIDETKAWFVAALTSDLITSTEPQLYNVFKNALIGSADSYPFSRSILNNYMAATKAGATEELQKRASECMLKYAQWYGTGLVVANYSKHFQRILTDNVNPTFETIITSFSKPYKGIVAQATSEYRNIDLIRFPNNSHFYTTPNPVGNSRIDFVFNEPIRQSAFVTQQMNITDKTTPPVYWNWPYIIQPPVALLTHNSTLSWAYQARDEKYLPVTRSSLRAIADFNRRFPGVPTAYGSVVLAEYTKNQDYRELLKATAAAVIYSEQHPETRSEVEHIISSQSNIKEAFGNAVSSLH